MEKFTLETGLEMSALELQSAFKTLYEAMISADEKEITLRNEGATSVDQFVALHEANLERLKNAIKSIWHWFVQKLEAFGKLIKEWYERMKKKLQEYLAFRNINLDAEIEWYVDPEKASDRILDMEQWLNKYNFVGDSFVKDYTSDEANRLTSDIDTLLKKHTIKASQVDRFKDKNSLKHQLKFMDDHIQKAYTEVNTLKDSASRYLAKISDDSYYENLNKDENFITRERAFVSDAIKIYSALKHMLTDIINTFFKALVKMGMKHTPEQDAKFSPKEESAIRLDDDMIYKCVCYEFDHIMDDCYVAVTGDLINGTAA